MSQGTTSMATFSSCVGVDLGDRFSHYCELDETGSVTHEGRIRTTQKEFSKLFEGRTDLRVAVETGTHCQWIHELLDGFGHDVIIANARKLRAIYTNPRKDDRVDARMLARLARCDVELLSPVEPRDRDTRTDLSLLRARACLVAQRTRIVNCIRGITKSHGLRLAGCTAMNMHKTVMPQVPDHLKDALEPLVATLVELKSGVREYDRQVVRRCEEVYPATARVMQIRGVGSLTALAFVLVVGDPERFKKPRDVAAYLGLVPGRSQSGDHDPEQRITKTGDTMLRSLLIQASHYLLGHFGEPCALRDFGERLVARGGKYAKQRAAVATARKLTVLMLSLWKSGQEYDPSRNRSELSKISDPESEQRFMGKVRIS